MGKVLIEKVLSPRAKTERRTHDRFLPDAQSGVFEFNVEAQRLHVGSGRLGVRGDGTLFAHAVGGRGFVIPGSSIKGAVRQIHELLTGSPDPWGKPEPSPSSVLFGALGSAGLVRFGECLQKRSLKAAYATPKVAWPGRSKTQDVYRFYDDDPPTDRNGKELPDDGPVCVVNGGFLGRVAFTNCRPHELGWLLIAMGIDDGLGRQRGRNLRLGGKRFCGFGKCSLTPQKVRLWRARPPGMHLLEGEKVWEWVDDCLLAVRKEDEERFERVLPVLEELASVHGGVKL